MTLFTMNDNIEEASVILNDDLSAISQWAKKWLVTFNPSSKTKSVHFTYKESEHLPDLFFDGTKHLGVTFSSDLSWNKHIDEVCSKASNRLDIMRTLKYKISRRSLEI